MIKDSFLEEILVQNLQRLRNIIVMLILWAQYSYAAADTNWPDMPSRETVLWLGSILVKSLLSSKAKTVEFFVCQFLKIK
jgi:hypothetical protein